MDAKRAMAQIREYRIEEAADALIEVLTARERLPVPAAVPKREVVGLVALQAERARRREAFIYKPAIEGRAVKVPDQAFVLANWRAICRVCAAAGFYVVMQRGKGGGIRLGTLQEYRGTKLPKPDPETQPIRAGLA